MKITVHVTKEILEKSQLCGLEGDDKMEKSCAIALAIREIFPNAYVQTWEMYPLNRLNDKIKLPGKASNFIMDFDHNTPEERVAMTPVSFEIDVPDSVIEKIGIAQVHAILKESKTLSLVDN